MHIIFISMLIEKYQKTIYPFIKFEKIKDDLSFPFNENEASRLSYLIGLLNKLPG